MSKPTEDRTGAKLVAYPRKAKEALAWLGHLGLKAVRLPDDVGRAAKAALVSALQRDRILPEGFAFRGDHGRVGPYLWDFLTAHEVSEERARAAFSLGGEFLAFFDSVPGVFACRRTGELPDIPKRDLTLLNLKRQELLAFNHEWFAPILYRITPPHRPHNALRPLVNPYVPEAT